jgi:2-polyprenyl-3-methyl-5-hydroxy-6-metoxy-1,4-benzoquinol methylase
MQPKTNKNSKHYWDHNIDKWADLYLDISHGHEEFDTFWIWSKLYNKFLVPYEAKLMKTRYSKTREFIEAHISSGMHVSDIGCGVGTFSVHLLLKGALVNVIDISKKSLALTKLNLEKFATRYLVLAQRGIIS